MQIAHAVVVEFAKDWYTYYAVLEDNSLVQLRKSRRLYPRAFFYSTEVCSGNKSQFSKHWTFGKAPSSYVKQYLARRYDVYRAAVEHK